MSEQFIAIGLVAAVAFAFAVATLPIAIIVGRRLGAYSLSGSTQLSG